MRPASVRNLILASAAPRGAAGMHGWAPWVIDAVGTPQLDPAGYLKVFFAESESSQQAGQLALQRMFTKASGFDQPTSWQTRQAQYDAVCAWGIPNHTLLQRLSTIQQRVFIANGESDPMILPHFSYLLAGLIPGGKVKIYPDSAHGFLFQHHAEFASDVEQFLCTNGGPDE
jgi:pimeloyl-ACP methyl ester carboxylesterase